MFNPTSGNRFPYYLNVSTFIWLVLFLSVACISDLYGNSVNVVGLEAQLSLDNTQHPKVDTQRHFGVCGMILD